MKDSLFLIFRSVIRSFFPYRKDDQNNNEHHADGEEQEGGEVIMRQVLFNTRVSRWGWRSGDGVYHREVCLSCAGSIRFRPPYSNVIIPLRETGSFDLVRPAVYLAANSNGNRI